MKGVKKCIKPNLVLSHFWGGGQKIKVAQNGQNHILALEFLKSNEILEMAKNCKWP